MGFSNNSFAERRFISIELCASRKLHHGFLLIFLKKRCSIFRLLCSFLSCFLGNISSLNFALTFGAKDFDPAWKLKLAQASCSDFFQWFFVKWWHILCLSAGNSCLIDLIESHCKQTYDVSPDDVSQIPQIRQMTYSAIKGLSNKRSLCHGTGWLTLVI